MGPSTRKFLGRLAVGAVAFAAGCLAVSPRVDAQFTAGYLVVDRIGTTGSTSALSSAATQTYLDEFSTLPGQTAPVLTITLNGLTNSGTATSEGFLRRSLDGGSLIVPGYNAAVGTASVSGTTYNGSPAVYREVGVVNAAGTVTSLTTLGNAYSGNNIRGAASPDGSTLFTTGAKTGVFTINAGSSLTGNNAPTLVSSTVTNTRAIDIFSVNNVNTTFFSTGSGTPGIYQVGTSTSTGSGQTASLVLTAAGTNASPYGFSISPNGLVAYVADDGGTSGTPSSVPGISEYTRTSTSGAFALAATFSTAARDVAVAYGATSNTIYFTNAAGTNLDSIVDDGTPSDFAGQTASLLATAGTNTVFRGLDFAPVPEPATVFSGLLLVGALGWNQRRRLGGLAGFLRLARVA